jgi:hypothetical protein
VTHPDTPSNAHRTRSILSSEGLPIKGVDILATLTNSPISLLADLRPTSRPLCAVPFPFSCPFRLALVRAISFFNITSGTPCFTQAPLGAFQLSSTHIGSNLRISVQTLHPHWVRSVFWARWLPFFPLCLIAMILTPWNLDFLVINALSLYHHDDYPPTACSFLFGTYPASRIEVLMVARNIRVEHSAVRCDKSLLDLHPCHRRSFMST